MDDLNEQQPLVSDIDERGGIAYPFPSETQKEGGNSNTQNDFENEIDPMNDPDLIEKKKKRSRIKKRRCCTYPTESDGKSQQSTNGVMGDCQVTDSFKTQQTWEIWLIFIIKLFTSIIFLVDDLTFLLYCQYEYKMTPSEAGILFCISAVCLFTYGLTISGFIIDKIGVKGSLILGLTLYAVGKFILVFADTRIQLYLIMTTIIPLGISIVFPSLILGVKRLTKEDARPIAFNIFYGAMVLGAIAGGPLVDYVRHDYKTTTWMYHHTNVETGRQVERAQEFSAWRTLCFIGFCINFFLLILLCFYKEEKEKPFQEEDVDWEEIEKLTFCGIFSDLFHDYKFWRFLLFSFILVGPKLVFSLLFFMLPRIIMQDYGEDAPFGVYIMVAPILIIVFLFCVAPAQNVYDPYDLILLGCLIATLGPIPMFFGMNIVDFIIFIVIISFAEALYSPMINVFTFNFTKPGREGTFLTLTAAPIYFTMAITGLMGGYLLENFYPAEEDEDHKRQPDWIWAIVIIVSGSCTLALYLLRDYFNPDEEEATESNASDQRSARKNE